MNISLKQYKGKAINVGEIFKKVIGSLKRADQTLLILPLKNSNTDTILHRIVHVPSKGEDLKNYLDFKMERFQVESLFKIRTSKSMYHLKNHPGTMDTLNTWSVYLRHTQLDTVKTKTIATLFCSHSFFTRREDTKREIIERIHKATNRECPPFILTPGYQTHLPPTDYYGNSPIIKQDTLLMESETKHADEILELMYIMMAEKDTSSWPITGHIKIIPIRPSGLMDENLIGRFAMKQNQFVASLENITLKGYTNIDEILELKNGKTITLREIILYSKDPDGKYFFNMIERASGNRIFLVYTRTENNQQQKKRYTVLHSPVKKRTI
jgi:hypothetical protein